MKNIVNIKLPKLSRADIKFVQTSVRPCRNGGLRSDTESINNKFIIHNYGHGGNGVALSYGTVILAIMRHELRIKKQHSSEVAVLGGGIIGLFTAKILAEKGYKVNLYAEELPM